VSTVVSVQVKATSDRRSVRNEPQSDGAMVNYCELRRVPGAERKELLVHGSASLRAADPIEGGENAVTPQAMDLLLTAIYCS